MMGFKTIGSPYMTGSLIPKIPGTMEIFAMSFARRELQNKNITINSERVDPPPPNSAKNASNSRLIMLGSAVPAVKAAWFSSVSAVKIGVKMGLVMFDPLMPKNQKMPWMT